jgi:hypothetical protein
VRLHELHLIAGQNYLLSFHGGAVFEAAGDVQSQIFSVRRDLIAIRRVAGPRVGTVARDLGAYAAIFAVVTMISGIYGMNFAHMPELGWRFGYAWALGLMVASAGGLWVYFKRKGWL